MAAPAPAPAPTPSVLPAKILSSPPTATVWVDGQQISGRTPVKVDLSPGRHAIRLESGGSLAEYVIDVTPDSPNKWCYDFGAQANKSGGC